MAQDISLNETFPSWQKNSTYIQVLCLIIVFRVSSAVTPYESAMESPSAQTSAISASRVAKD
jgi:hypothetical protein